MLIERVSHDGAGRVGSVTLAGRTFAYSYNWEGRLGGFSGPDGSTSASYDVFGNRTRYSADGITTRMVYDGTDPVLDLVDNDGDGTIDRRRYYFLTGGIDQRGGFIDVVDGQTARVCYYLTDHVGSVLQIVDDNGDVLNQYDYDAFGNIRWENSYETIPNRYTC